MTDGRDGALARQEGEIMGSTEQQAAPGNIPDPGVAPGSPMPKNGQAGSGGEVDPDMEAMWNRFHTLSEQISESNTRQQTEQKKARHTPMKFPTLELNESVPEDSAGSEAVDAVLASASSLESSNAVLPALLSLDSLFEECLRPHAPLIAALARPEAISKMIHYAVYADPDIGGHNGDRLAFASCKLLSCGWWGRTHGVLDMLVSADPLDTLLEYPSRVTPPMPPQAGFYWARIMRAVLNEKHAEVLEYLRQDARLVVGMLASLAEHAASETEAGPLLWEMLTDEELANLAAEAGAGPHVARSLLLSLQVAARTSDEEALSVGTRLIASVLELGNHVAPHFRNSVVRVVPEVCSLFTSVDLDGLILSLPEILLAVLSPTQIESPSPAWLEAVATPPTAAAQAAAAREAEHVKTSAAASSAAANQATVDNPGLVQACQRSVVELMHKFLAIGEQNGTSLVRRRRRQTSFQFTVMRPKGGRPGNSAAAAAGLGGAGTMGFDTYRSVTALGNTAFGRRQAAAMAGQPRQRTAAAGGGGSAVPQTQAGSARGPNPVPAHAPVASASTRLKIGTAELALVRAVGRLLQGDPADWDYNQWAAEQFVQLGLGDHCVALLCEFEDREHDLLHCALMEVLEAVVLCGVPRVAEAVLFKGTMGGLARFIVATFRRSAQKRRRGGGCAHLVEIANAIEGTPELAEMVRRGVTKWPEFVAKELASENDARRHVFDVGSGDDSDMM